MAAAIGEESSKGCGNVCVFGERRRAATFGTRPSPCSAAIPSLATSNVQFTLVDGEIFNAYLRSDRLQSQRNGVETREIVQT